MLHVVPKSSRNEIVGWKEDAEGQKVLKVKINAVPEDGKATKAVIAFLAKQWHVPAARLELVSGAASRYKRLRISNDLHQRVIADSLTN